MKATVPLKRLSTVIAGQSPPSEAVSELNDDLPFLQGNAEFQHFNPKARFSCSSAPKLAEPGDVLLSVRAPVGALNIADQRYGIGRGLCAIRPGDNADARYLWWALHASLPLLHALAVGSTYDSVTADVVAEIPVASRRPGEQRHIADYLDAETDRIDSLISKKRRMVELLEARLVGGAEDAVAGSGGDQMTGTPSLPEVPSSWRVLRNKVFIREVDGRSSDGSGEMLSVSHITGVTPRSEKTVHMFKAESTVGYKLVRCGDLVINTMWAWMGAAGVAEVPGIVSPAYGVYEFDRDIMLPKFFDILIHTPAYITEMTRFSRGVTSSRLRLYPYEFLRLSSPVPPLDIQREIVDNHRAHHSTTRLAHRRITEQIELLQERRRALIAAVVTGEMPIPHTRVIADMV